MSTPINPSTNQRVTFTPKPLGVLNPPVPSNYNRTQNVHNDNDQNQNPNATNNATNPEALKLNSETMAPVKQYAQSSARHLNKIFLAVMATIVAGLTLGRKHVTSFLEDMSAVTNFDRLAKYRDSLIEASQKQPLNENHIREIKMHIPAEKYFSFTDAEKKSIDEFIKAPKDTAKKTAAFDVVNNYYEITNEQLEQIAKANSSSDFMKKLGNYRLKTSFIDELKVHASRIVDIKKTVDNVMDITRMFSNLEEVRPKMEIILNEGGRGTEKIVRSFISEYGGTSTTVKDLHGFLNKYGVSTGSTIDLAAINGYLNSHGIELIEEMSAGTKKYVAGLSKDILKNVQNVGFEATEKGYFESDRNPIIVRVASTSYVPEHKVNGSILSWLFGKN